MSRVPIALFILSLVAILAPVKGAPTPSLILRQGTNTSSFQLQNALDAQQLNIQFSALKASDSCTEGSQACVTSGFAQCVSGKWVITPCVAGTSCFALPLVTKPGTSINCDSQSDAAARFAAAGAQNGTGISTTPVSGNSTLPANAATGSGVNDGDCDDGSGASNAANTPNANTTVPPDTDCDDGTTATPSSSSPTTTTSATPAASPTTAQLNRRQFSNITLVTVPASTSTTLLTTTSPSTSTLAASSSPTNALPATTSSSAISASPLISTTSTNTFADPPPIQTAIGTDGLPTVTVTVTAVPCSTASSTGPALLPTVASSSGTLANAPTVVSSTTSLSASPNIVVSSAPILSSSGTNPKIPSPSTATAVSSTSTSTSAAQSGFTFDSGAPAPTVAPGNSNGAVNNGNGAGSSSVDVSMLLTATVGSTY